ncbi:MAG: dioxygenase [Deltaproteobacteria bacterium]|nr:dioxygenase [Deltaproteobacteria bacterium]
MSHRHDARVLVTRRGFLRSAVAGSAAALGLGAFGLGCAAEPSPTPTFDGSPRPADGGGLRADLVRGRSDGAATGDAKGGDGPRRDLSPTCGELTEPNIEGPFFKVGSPERGDLREPGMAGVRLEVAGRVLGRDCRPVAGALLDFWHANQDGAYDNVGFRLRGHQRTDASGRYLLQTIVPGHYLNGATYRPAHVHVKVGGAGFMVLTTQLYFPGDPYNAGDPFIRPSLIMPVTDVGGMKRATFDFVLARASR